MRSSAFTLALMLASSSAMAQTSSQPPQPPPQPTTPQPSDALRVQQLERAQMESAQRMQALEQELGRQKERTIELEGAARQGTQALQQLQQLTAAGGGYEAARQQRSSDYDVVQSELMNVEATMAHGWWVEQEDFDKLQADLAALTRNAEQTSGRLEVIYVATASQHVTWAIEALSGHDYFVARQHMFSAIDNVVQARNAATANPMPAWRP